MFISVSLSGRHEKGSKSRGAEPTPGPQSLCGRRRAGEGGSRQTPSGWASGTFWKLESTFHPDVCTRQHVTVCSEWKRRVPRRPRLPCVRSSACAPPRVRHQLHRWEVSSGSTADGRRGYRGPRASEARVDSNREPCTLADTVHTHTPAPATCVCSHLAMAGRPQGPW